MQDRGWKCLFSAGDSKWNATTITKASLGGQSTFNTVNFGMLMTTVPMETIAVQGQKTIISNIHTFGLGK